MKKYAYYWCKCLKEKRKLDDGSMIDFRNVLSLACILTFHVVKKFLATSNMVDDLLLPMAVLAEHFGYLSEAYDFAKRISTRSNHIDRIAMQDLAFKFDLSTFRKSHMSDSKVSGALDQLKHLYGFSLKELTGIVFFANFSF